jgi:iron complex transport system substrate-binding protein
MIQDEPCGVRMMATLMAKLAAAVMALAACVAGAAAAEAPRRIVSFNVCADQLVVALADPEQIAGLSPYAADPVVSVVADKARAFRRLGWQAESTIPLDPDLVLIGPNDRSPTQRLLRGLGYRVEPVGLIGDVAGARAQIVTVAAMLGHPERGAALVAQVDAARARLAVAPRPASTSALLIGNAGYTDGPASLAAAILIEAGLTPPAGAPGGYGGFVPLERLVALRPDYLVMSNLIETPDTQGAVYLTHPALRTLYPPARRIMFPTRFTLCGGPSLVAALDYLADTMTRLATEFRPPPIHR